MTPPELIFRLVLVVFGVAVVGLIAWMWAHAQDGESVLVIVIAFGVVALVLLMGGIGGPDAVKAFWG